jgi:putative membrane protein
VHVHTVSGPVSARIGALDAGDAQRLWSGTTERAVEAAAADTSHRWRDGQEARPGSDTPGRHAQVPAQGPAQVAAAGQWAGQWTGAAPAAPAWLTQDGPPVWTGVPGPGAVR